MENAMKINKEEMARMNERMQEYQN